MGENNEVNHQIANLTIGNEGNENEGRRVDRQLIHDSGFDVEMREMENVLRDPQNNEHPGSDLDQENHERAVLRMNFLLQDQDISAQQRPPQGEGAAGNNDLLATNHRNNVAGGIPLNGQGVAPRGTIPRQSLPNDLAGRIPPQEHGNTARGARAGQGHRGGFTGGMPQRQGDVASGISGWWQPQGQRINAGAAGGLQSSC